MAGIDVVEMRKKGRQLLAEARQMVDRAEVENRDLTTEEKTNYEKYIADATSLTTRATRMEQQLRMEADMDATTGQRAMGADDPGVRKMTTEDARAMRTAFRNVLRYGDKSLSEYRALQSDVPSAGGFFVVPEEISTEIIKELDASVYIRSKAHKIQLDKARSLGVIKRTRRGTSFVKGSEIGTVQEGTDAQYGKRVFEPHPHTGLLKISKDLILYSSDPENELREDIAVDRAEYEEGLFLNGTGAQEPLGVLVKDANGVDESRWKSAGNTNAAIKFDGLKACKYSLKQGYLQNAEWMFHGDAMLQIATLKTGDGQYLWDPASTRVGEPEKLLGLPMVTSAFMPNTFTTGKPVGLLADWRHYWIVDALNTEIQVLVEKYAENNLIGYLTRIKFDGQPRIAEAFSVLALA